MLRNSFALFMYAASVTLGVSAGKLTWAKFEAKYLK